MKNLILVLLAATGLLFPRLAQAQAQTVDWSKVDQAMDKKGAVQPGGVYKIGLPRSDLHVTLDGVELDPAFALGSHVEFMPMDKKAMVMGDLVLAGEEVSPVMEKLISGGVEIEALHNHLLRTIPPVWYMHIGAQGDPVGIAKTIHEALALSGTPFGASVKSAAAPSFDTSAIDKIIGRKGKPNGAIYQIGIPRAETVSAAGMTLPAAMGIANAINFQAAGKHEAAVTGDFALLASEVNPVLRALRRNGIEVTALHSHMLDDEPRLFFMHFWGKGDAVTLAKGLRAALDQVNIKKD
jgi:hypothetical protein